MKKDGTIDLFFGPNVPAGQEDVWVKTLPDRNWFCYFRTYGPEAPLYDGSWKLADFVEITALLANAKQRGIFPIAPKQRCTAETAVHLIDAKVTDGVTEIERLQYAGLHFGVR